MKKIGTLNSPENLTQLLLNLSAQRELGVAQIITDEQLYHAAELIFGREQLRGVGVYTPRDVRTRAAEMKKNSAATV